MSRPRVVGANVSISVYNGLTDEQPVILRIEGAGICIIRGLSMEEATTLARGILIAKHDHLEGKIDTEERRLVN